MYEYYVFMNKNRPLFSVYMDKGRAVRVCSLTNICGNKTLLFS
jgi:hypothetical protein